MTTMRNVGFLVLAGIAFMGCGGDDNGGVGKGAGGGAGSISPSKVDPTGGTAGTDGEDADLERFIGTWKYTSGTATRICAGQADTFPLAGNDDEFAHAVDGGLTLKGTCAAKLTVTGDTASLAPSATTCTQVNDDGSSVTMMYSSLSYTTSDGRNMTISASGTQTFLTDGQSVACSFSVTGALAKYAD
jgi:hypothetical protein